MRLPTTPLTQSRMASDASLASATGARSSTRAYDDRVPESQASDLRFQLLSLMVFALIVGVLSVVHEPWNAETQSWRLAIDSDGPAALLRNSRYEGHPLLYHYLLQLVGHVSRSWWAAIATNFLIACGSAWIVLRFAPFTRIEKLLVIGGYFPLYEYSVPVREYGLGMLLAFASCAAWTVPRRRPVLAIACLVLLANTSVFGLFLALAAGAAFVVDWLWADRFTFALSSRQVAIGVLCLGLTLAVTYLVALQVIPPADAAYKGEGAAVGGRGASWDVGFVLSVPLRALVPLAKIGEGTVQWNRWLFEPGSRAGMIAAVLLSGVVVAMGCIISSRRRASLVFYVLSTAGLVAFFHLYFKGFARHHGHLFVAWIMAAWLARSGAPSAWPQAVQALVDRTRLVAPRLLAISLVPLTFAAAEFAVADVLLPNSDVFAVVDLLRARGLAARPLVGISRSNGTAVGAILDRPVLLPIEGRASRYVVWGPPVFGEAAVAAISRSLDSLLAVECDAVVISTLDDDVPESLRPRMRLIYETPYRPMTRERFRVWTTSAPPSTRCPSRPSVSGPA
jgi:hypothetical protein